MTANNQIPVFVVGGRARLHPASDWFMRGVRYATIVKVGRKYVHLQIDGSTRVIRVAFRNVTEVTQ